MRKWKDNHSDLTKALGFNTCTLCSSRASETWASGSGVPLLFTDEGPEAPSTVEPLKVTDLLRGRPVHNDLTQGLLLPPRQP